MSKTALLLASIIGVLAAAPEARAQAVVFETTSAYHHIRVVDHGGLRILRFDNSQETRMSLRNPMEGHFEYTEFFHLPLVWNANITNVLMIGLGGGSTQRSFQHYHPQIHIDTVELDPAVVEVAKQYFGVQETPFHKIHTGDGRMILRRARTAYDLIVMDAYATGRYGSQLPRHLVTQEFFQIAGDKLSDNGIIAYNIIGSYHGEGAQLLGAIYRTMRTVFPQVYVFPARDSMNVVLVGVKSKERISTTELNARAQSLMRTNRVRLPTFVTRLRALRIDPPPRARTAPVLTDDFAPIEGLLNMGQ